MAIFIDVGTEDTVTNWDELVQRKIFFIHGTASNNTRLDSYGEARRAMNIIGFDIVQNEWETFMTSNWEDVNCDYRFSWAGILSNSHLNSVLERANASKNLVEYVKEKANPSHVREVVLAGHSHGGNVAIQAADRLAEIYDKVYIISVATPAQNAKQLSVRLPFTGPVGRLARFLVRTFTDADFGKINVYTNPENPYNLTNRDKIVHLALWNKKDVVDELALVLENTLPRVAGMTSNSDYFEPNGITRNVMFNIDLEGFMGSHGLDTNAAGEILNAIKNGDITPFERTLIRRKD